MYYMTWDYITVQYNTLVTWHDITVRYDCISKKQENKLDWKTILVSHILLLEPLGINRRDEQN